MLGLGRSSSKEALKASSSMEAVDTVKVVDAVLDQTSKNVLIGAIDQGTSSTRFLLFTEKGQIAAWAQMEHKQIFPSDHVGWHEHDPLQIWQNVVYCIDAVVQAMKDVDYSIAAIGITNQRETTIAWNADTGNCYYNAIVWDDTRTTSVANHIAQGNINRLRPQTGLPLTSYFAGTKVKWLLDNVESLQRDMMKQPEVVRFGTIDTWILYQLTGTPTGNGGNVGGLFLTDATNASRWLFLDLEKVQWDPKLVGMVCSPHDVPLSALPEVRTSSEVYATLKKASTGIDKLDGVPVSSILGDQQAALFGQVAFEPGEAKNTYGTGMFLMMNTGAKLVASHHGLLTTVAYHINDQVVYGLEGSVSHSGSTIQWLRDQLEMIETASDSETYATPSNDGLYLVPAFAGLFAPHWRSDARGCIVGITAAHHRGHILRAALEAAAYQAREVFDAIYADSHVLLKALKVDGGGTHNKLLMQFQADMINAPVVIPKVQETTAMGAAFAAGLAVGVWNDMDEIKKLWQVETTFLPEMKDAERQKNWLGWKKAISKSLNWIEVDEDHDEHFLDAETFNEDDDEYIAAVTGTYPIGQRVSILSLMTIAAIGASIGFALGRRK
jgi:glycerol kinase